MGKGKDKGKEMGKGKDKSRSAKGRGKPSRPSAHAHYDSTSDNGKEHSHKGGGTGTSLEVSPEARKASDSHAKIGRLAQADTSTAIIAASHNGTIIGALLGTGMVCAVVLFGFTRRYSSRHGYSPI